MIRIPSEKSKIFDATLLFLITFCLIELFGFNSDRFEGSAVIRNIAIPYVDINITASMALISLVAITIIFIGSNKRANNIDILLAIRIPLYFIPVLYISGNFKIGIAYAIFQCLFSYYIGRNYLGDFSNIIKIIALFTVGIALEVYSVLIINGISVFAPNLKWYMVIPMGRSNYIDTILIPSFIIVDVYYAHRNNIWLRLVYILFVGGAVLATGSKFALFVFVLYLTIETLSYLSKSRKVSRAKVIRGATLALVLLLLLLGAFICFQNEVSLILLKYVQNNIFENRIRVFSDSISLIYKNPIFGRSAYSYIVFDAVKAHNWILESLIQTGIMGSLIYIYTLILSIRRIKRIEDDRIKRMWYFFAAFYLSHGLGEPNLFGSTSDAFFWLMIGLSNCKVGIRINNTTNEINVMEFNK